MHALPLKPFFPSSCRANNAKVNFREKEKKILDQILGAGKYDARIRPSGINGTGKASLLCPVCVCSLSGFCLARTVSFTSLARPPP